MASIQSVEDVEKLVKELYNPANKPSQVEALQAHLQEVQRSSEWAFAEELLKSQDQNVRFFAALTFTVKINQSGSILTEEEQNWLLEKLVSWLIRLSDQDESLLVLRKLCSTLVALFLISNSTWKGCVRHLSCCFYLHDAHPNLYWDRESATGCSETGGQSYPDTEQIYASLSRPRTRTVLIIFVTILAEDAIRVDHSSLHFDHTHQRVKSNIEDVIKIITDEFATLQTPSQMDDILQCFLSWINYSREEFLDSIEVTPRFGNLLKEPIRFLYKEDFFQDVAQFLIDLFAGGLIHLNHARVTDLYQFLISPWSVDRFLKLELGEMDDDSILLGQLMFSFGQTMSKGLIEGVSPLEEFIKIIHRLTSFQNYESMDQSLFNASIDFWENFCSIAPVISDDEITAESMTFKTAKHDWLQAMDELIRAAALPLGVDGELKTIRSDDPFSEFRSRVYGAIQSSYLNFEVAVFEKLVTMAVVFGAGHVSGYSSQYALGQLEFVLYCISGLSDSMEHQSGLSTTEASLLNQLFSSLTYSNLSNFGVACPEKLRKRAIAVIGDQEGHFRNRSEDLFSAFDFLFRALDYSGLCYTSARSIYLLAENNRKLLTPKVEDFLQTSERLLMSSHVESAAKEYVVGSVAGIIQALENENNRYISLMRICNYIQKSMESKLNNAMNTEAFIKERHEHAIDAMGYLKALGKAFQVPDNQTISLDDDDDENDFSRNSRDLTEIQCRLIEFIDLILQPHREDGPLLVATCDVFRTGYRELKPGPFTFDARITADFITAVPMSNPCLDTAVLTGSVFLNSQIAKKDASVDSILRLLRFVCDTVEHLRSPEADPDLAYACVEFFSNLFQGHLNRLKEIPPKYVTMLLEFTILCLEGSNFLPKKASTQMWRVFFDSFQRSRDFLGGLILDIGPPLTNSFIRSFGGNATRSELPLLTEPFRKMIFIEPLSKGWMEKALFSTNFPSSRITDADKRKFIAQISHLRGDRTTQAVVKNFWLVCRGTPAGYG